MPSKVSSKSAAAEEAIKKFREVSAANLSILAKGNQSRLQKYLGAQQEHPKNFAWLSDNAPVVVTNDENSNPQNNSEVPRNSEYKESFVSWPLPDATTVPQPSKWSPNSLFPTEIDSSKWASEHKTMFSNVADSEFESGDVAGIKTKTALTAPTFFAWKKAEVQKRKEPIIDQAYEIEENIIDIEEPADFTPDTIKYDEIKVEELIKKVESPLVSYEDAIDPSKWKSEYNTNFTNDAEIETFTAGITTKSELGHPSNFAWEANTVDQLLPPPPPTENIFKHVTFDNNPISEYAENFQKRLSLPVPVEKCNSNSEVSAPIPSYSDHIDVSKWKSEYSCHYSLSKKSTVAPIPRSIIENEIENEEAVAEPNQAVDEPVDRLETIIVDNYVIVDSTDIPQSFPETVELTPLDDIESTPKTTTFTGRSNMENNLYFPKTEIEVASRTSAEPAKSRKLWFTSEQRDEYQWPTAATLPQKSKIAPITSKENIFAICQSLDGNDLIKSKSTLTIGPKMTTETRSMYAWPDSSMIIKRNIIAPKSQMSLGDEPVIIENTNTTTTTMSTDSIVPVVASTHEVVAPAPSVPIVFRQRELAEIEPSEITTLAGPKKTTSLQLQDSASAMRIANATGLRLNDHRVINCPHSAPKRRTSSFVADQIIAQQTKKGSVDPFNPILMHKRFPMSSDKQIGRWRTETKASFVWSKKKNTI